MTAIRSPIQVILSLRSPTSVKIPPDEEPQPQPLQDERLREQLPVHMTWGEVRLGCEDGGYRVGLATCFVGFGVLDLAVHRLSLVLLFPTLLGIRGRELGKGLGRYQRWQSGE